MIKLFRITILCIVTIMASCSKEEENLETELVEKEETISEAKKSSTLKSSEFITTWEGLEVTIPVDDFSSYNFNYNVDWNNDGIVDETGITGEVTHVFATPGRHTIRISGEFPEIKCSLAGEEAAKKIVSINQWGTIKWKSMASAFAFTEIEFLATDTPDLSGVTNMSYMFDRSKSTNLDVSNWDVSNITNMRNMFYNAKSVNPDVSKWDVSKVKRMEYMFSGTVLANPDVSKWDVSNVTRMDHMFSVTESATPDVSNWNVSKVNSMRNMFFGAKSANPDVSNWNVSKVRSMSLMFFGATSANPDVSKWNIAKVRNMRWMFKEATSFSTANYEKLLINFANQPHSNNVVFDAEAKAVSAQALAARQILINDGWKITDGNTP